MVVRMKIVLLFTLLSWISVLHGYKYVFVPLQMKSHIAGQVFIAQELANQGHDAYMIVVEAFTLLQTVIDISGIKLLHPQADDEVFESSLFDGGLERRLNSILQSASDLRTTFPQASRLLQNLATKECRTMVQDTRFMETIKEHQFDLAIVDATPFAACSAVIPYHVGIPFVSMFTQYIPASHLPIIPSFVPYSHGPFSDTMSFIDRLQNLLMHAHYTLVLLPLLTEDTSLLQEYPAPNGVSAESWTDLQAKSSLFIMTRDHLLEWPIPTMPYYILLPGITPQPAKPLNPDLDTFMSSTKEGVVLVSFGSILSGIDPFLIDRLLTAFRALPELSFVFKMSEVEQKSQVDIPANVLVVDWMPQNDMLGHKATKGFITHCGNNGQYEALYHGVPMIGLPHFGDQHHNCFRIAEKMVGLCMDTKLFTPQELITNIHRITSEASFGDNVKVLSSIMKESELPSARAAYWIEHVTKYGAKHLLSNSIGMPWYQYWMVDLALLLTTLAFVALFTLYKICNFVALWQ